MTNMDKMYYISTIAGLLLVAVIFAVIAFIKKKSGKGQEAQYDVRQMLARGQAYRIGFFTMMAYFLLYGIADGLGFVWCESFIGCFIGIMMGAVAFALTAIRKDAYHALNEKPGNFYLVSGLVIGANVLAFIAAYCEGSLIVDGKLTKDAAGSLVGVLWLVILITQLVHNRKLKKQAAAEDEE